MIDLEGKHIVVIGLARTGAAVARCSRALGARVTVLEQAERPTDEQAAAGLTGMGVELVFGSAGFALPAGADMVVPSPGVPPRAPAVGAAQAAGLPILSEVELAFRLTERPVIAVTGTNGKTTTVTLLGEMLAAAGITSDVCGNIGRPMIDFALAKQRDPLVVEVSSFQLEFTGEFAPKTAVLLNITPDHLDWHGAFDLYKEAKQKIFNRQKPTDFAVVAAGEPFVPAGLAAERVVFGGSRGGVFCRNGWITHDLGAGAVRIFPVVDLFIRGRHNLENAMAATAAALVSGVDAEFVAAALKNFKGVEHRLEFAAESGGVLYFNDSKATNPEAAAKAIGAFDEKIVLLAGGRNKGNNFEGLAREAAGRVKLALVFGESASDLSKAFARYSVETRKVGALDESVRLAAAAASPGDVVLLSPACASFDMFSDYEARGRCFKEAVLAELGQVGKA